ncbi:DevA family ABC transporter ATP-binding protein [Synechococcus sp. Nb3U1]|uniref:DevA family ABC transporter ATP-binding protein n=1 Tax=Synechococcus sp. Nb3U1 TaxID=1914529 RepID=UPI001F26D8EE|nr:DevA family ABC transporter ATP-binding protein [Synechococcus sp. Nb3U1]MCF2970539.1 DevA family ABC transporter ATP-binding protein [Synechococcus sp. Nb3U1]
MVTSFFTQPIAPPVTASGEPVLRVEGLNHYFGEGSLRKQILFDINLTLNSGEIVLMTGPSGSGKTTLLTLLGALRSVQEGSLRMMGQELRGAEQSTLIQARKQVGYIFQAHNLLKCLTAAQNVQMSLELHDNLSRKQAKQRAEEMLAAVGLADRTHYYPEKLSGGQKQRVAIARALVSHPKLVLADEPTAALDSKSGREVVTLMEKLAREQGCTILMVTHDNRILDVADRVLHMEDGRLQSQSIA